MRVDRHGSVESHFLCDVYDTLFQKRNSRTQSDGQFDIIFY